jgi:hypothetical protein
MAPIEKPSENRLKSLGGFVQRLEKVEIHMGQLELRE